MTKYTEKTLVFHLHQGNQAAFQHLHSHYSTALLGVIQQLVKDPTEAEDLLQDTFVKVWQRFSTYDPEKSGLFNWLFTIARHTALDSIRRRKLACYTLGIEPDIMAATLSYWPTTDTIGIRYMVSLVLTPHQWQVIDLAYWQGYTAKEIADQLSLPIGTVKTRIRKSLIDLRPLFVTVDN